MVTTYVLIILLIDKVYNINPIRDIKYKTADLFYVAPLLPLLLAEHAFVGISHQVLLSVGWLDIQSFKKFSDFHEHFGSVFYSLFIAAFFEEVIFRGVVLKILLSRFRAITAVAISALMFSLWHLNPIQFLGAFIFGIIAGYLYIKTGSILICIIAHYMANAFAWMRVKDLFYINDLWLESLLLLYAIGLAFFTMIKVNKATRLIGH